MESQPQTQGSGARAGDRQGREQQLAAALRDLIRQVDLSDYRDRQGVAMRDTPAFRKAQALVDQFDVTDEQLRLTLEESALAGDLVDANPPEYWTWHTGP